MIFSETQIQNFRNFDRLKIEWCDRINLILGLNGKGKTNLLESLSILSGWGGFSGTRNLINWNNSLQPAYLSAKISGEENFNLTSKITSRISIKLENKKISCTDLRELLPCIIFLTGSINLIDATSAARRLFVDKLCALIHAPYAKALADFKAVNKIRVNLLKARRSPNPTTALFCKTGGYIMETRRKVIAMLKNLLSGSENNSENNFELKILPDLKNLTGAEFLYNSLNLNREREISAMRPLSGVNFDDLVFIFNNNKSASEFLSRGQKRMLILNLIITSGNLIYARLKRKPILFFDDLTAELDVNAREKVLSKLQNTGWQIFLTAPENPFDKKNSVNKFIKPLIL